MTCEGCRYWSERMAQTTERGFVEAMCLHPDRPRAFMRAGCRGYVAGEAIDLDDQARAINERIRQQRERRERHAH